MNMVKLVDIELVKEIRKYDRVMVLVGFAGLYLLSRIGKLEKRITELEKQRDFTNDEIIGFDKYKEKSKED